MQCLVHCEHRPRQGTVFEARGSVFHTYRLSAQAVFTIGHSGRFHGVRNGYGFVRTLADNDQPDDIIMQVFSVTDHFAVEAVVCQGCTWYSGFPVVQRRLGIEGMGNMVSTPVSGLVDLLRGCMCMSYGNMNPCGGCPPDKFLTAYPFRRHGDQPYQGGILCHIQQFLPIRITEIFFHLGAGMLRAQERSFHMYAENPRAVSFRLLRNFFRFSDRPGSIFNGGAHGCRAERACSGAGQFPAHSPDICFSPHGIAAPECVNVNVHKSRQQVITFQVDHFLSGFRLYTFADFRDYTVHQPDTQVVNKFFSCKNDTVFYKHFFFVSLL